MEEAPHGFILLLVGVHSTPKPNLHLLIRVNVSISSHGAQSSHVEFLGWFITDSSFLDHQRSFHCLPQSDIS